MADEKNLSGVNSDGPNIFTVIACILPFTVSPYGLCNVFSFAPRTLGCLMVVTTGAVPTANFVGHRVVFDGRALANRAS